MVEHMVDELVDMGKEFGEELFDYNRENFFFNQEQNIERQFQEQDMRLEKFNLYREDVRDLMELTTGKMDSYILPILFELNACWYLLVRGALWSDELADEVVSYGESPKEIPMWLIWLYVINLGEAFLYLLTALWLAIHASVSAHSFGVRLLTQFVRLPVPTQAQMKASYRYAAEFEGTGATAMMRVPALHRTAYKYLQGVAERALGDGDDDSPSGRMLRDRKSFASSFKSTYNGAYHDDTGPGALALAEEMQNLSPVMTLKHVRLYRELQANWQAHDAYARACLSLGTYTFVYSLAYYLLALLVVWLRRPICAAGAVCILVMLSFLMISLDLYYKTYFFIIGSFSLMLGPAFAAFAIIVEIASDIGADNWCWIRSYIVPLIFAMQAFLCLAMLLIVRGRQVSAGGQARVSLPTRFKSVLFLDVFGWMKDDDYSSDEEEEESFGDRIRRRITQPFAKPANVGLPQFVRAALEKELVTSSKMVKRELEVWKNDAVAKNIKAIPNLASGIAALQAQFDGLQSELQAFHTDPGLAEQTGFGASGERRLSDASSLEAFALEDPTSAIWLRLVWQSGGASVEYFVQASTGETRSSIAQLPENALVSDPEQIKERLEQLREQVTMLKESSQEKPVTSPQSGPERDTGACTRSRPEDTGGGAGQHLSMDIDDGEESDHLLTSQDESSRQTGARKPSNLKRLMSFMKGEKGEPPPQHADEISDTESTQSDAEALHRWASPSTPERSRSAVHLTQMGAARKERRCVTLPAGKPEIIQPLELSDTDNGFSNTWSLSMPSASALSRLRNRSASTFSGAPSLASRAPHRPTWSPSASSSVNRTRQTLRRGTTRVINEDEEQAVTNPESRRTQVLDFGGREAAHVEKNRNFYSTTETAAQTFHPKRDGRKESKRAPGQVPWLTFLSASGVLAIIWLIGMGGIIYEDILHPDMNKYSNHRRDKGKNASQMLVANAEEVAALPAASVVLDADTWQRRPVPAAPVGIACHAAMSGVIFFAEQYAVYEIRLAGFRARSEGAVERSADIENCLAQQPGFHAAGLRGLTMECSTGGDCYAMLLNVAGTHVLRCPLQHDQHQGDVHCDSRASRIVQLADAWGALAAPSFDHGNARYWWGIPANTAASQSPLVRLRVKQDAHGASKAFPTSCNSRHKVREASAPGDGDSLLASPGVSSSISMSMRSLHAYGSSALLGVSLDGQLLHAWGTGRDPRVGKLLPLGQWSLPKSHQWLASCAVPGGVFAIGRRQGETLQAAEVWQFELPEVLKELVMADENSGI